jgi:UMF1 family MFS transporter
MPPRPEIIVRDNGEIEVVQSATLTERGSWALFDFSSTIFSMNIITLFFPVWIATDLGAGTHGYALASSLCSVLVMLTMPLFGTISDERRRRKTWVIGLTLLATAATLALGPIGQRTGESTVMLALLAFVVANYAHQVALPFYNAMLPELVPDRARGRLSGYGTAMGYVGSIVGVLLITPFFNDTLPGLGPLPASVMTLLRRIPYAGEAGRAATFVPTALLSLAMATPLFLFCRDHLALPRAQWPRLSIAKPFRDIFAALRDTRNHPGLLRFLITTYFYQDAIGTTISFMAIYTVAVMGFAKGAEVTLFLILTIPSIFGAALIGWLSDRFGPKRTMMGVLLIWTATGLAITLVRSQSWFWALGALLGFIFGGVRTTERPLLLTLVPDVEAGRYFGLLVLSARAAAIAGPLIWALVVDVIFHDRGPEFSYRVAMGSLTSFMAVAAWLLIKVPDLRQRESLA